jgi:hypothetical protein
MNNEEKLKKLLEIAVENGWKLKTNAISTELNPIIIGQTCIYKNFYFLCYDKNWTSTVIYRSSLNDLVTNWNPNEISFIQALCNKSRELDMLNDGMIGMKDSNYIRNVTHGWSDAITDEKLNFLFKTFKHLL